MPNPTTYSPAALQLARTFEGCRLTAYQDQANIWTIGYGHTGPHVTSGLTITQAQAETLLADDLATAAACVSRLVKIPLNQNQFDALVDFVFNLGCRSLTQSTLLAHIQANNFEAAAKEFLRWNKAANKPVKGLTRRRQAEAGLFTAATSSSPHQP
ncbi:lysozyme [Edaphobacter flagellatus]|uniref:lysozyme n=1 Tax=Edaphobacter flagellatus TaxID=1933044 RepID=UPI0021B38AE6|nr:lysozyme [Edaphobacter flagellatus]